MADALALQEILTAIRDLGQRALAIEARITTGDTNVQTVISGIDTRITESEKKHADAMTAIAASMAQLHSGLAAMTPTPATPPGIAVSSAAGPDAAAATGSPQIDPWLYAVPPAAQPNSSLVFGPSRFPTNIGDTLKTKDFRDIQKFDGDLTSFADWIDRMSGKMFRAHPCMKVILEWAENHLEVITEPVEKHASATFHVDLVEISNAVFDVIMEKTGHRLYNKRTNAGRGRGLEFWRLLKRDYGMESADAQFAKLQMFYHPAKCGTIQGLGEALDRWEALGREITRPVDDDFRLLALKMLVPKSMGDQMATQVQLRTFADSLMYVRRQVAEQRHASQVLQVQRESHQGQAPMDLSALFAAIASLHTGSSEPPPETDEPVTDWETFIAALGGKSKGKGKPKTKEDRECYTCGKVGHLARDCRSTGYEQKAESNGDGKGNGKGKGKGKG